MFWVQVTLQRVSGGLTKGSSIPDTGRLVDAVGFIPLSQVKNTRFTNRKHTHVVY